MTETTPYPIPRSVRQTDILVGNGTAGPYGPFAFKVFDLDDVVVYRRDLGDVSFLPDATVTLAKVADLALDFFTVTFAAAIPATTEFQVVGARVHERNAAVKAGTQISIDALERELSKMAIALQELRRDVLLLDPAIEEGDTLKFQDGRLMKGANALDIADAQTYASEARGYRDEAEAAAEAAALWDPAGYYTKAQIDTAQAAQDAAIAARALASRALTAGAGLEGGGTLSADRSFSVDFADASDIAAGTANKVVDAAQFKDHLPAGRNIIATRDIVSSVASVAFTEFDADKYLGYEIFLCEVVVSAADALVLQVSANGGSSYDAGSTDYASGGACQVYNGGNAYGGALAHMLLTGMGTDVPSVASGKEGISGRIDIIAPEKLRNSRVLVDVSYARSYDGVPASYRGYGVRNALSAVNAVRIKPLSGNLLSGQVHLVGISRG